MPLLYRVTIELGSYQKPTSELFLLKFTSCVVSFNSIVRRTFPSGHGQYHIRMIPYQDAGFHLPMTSSSNIAMEIDQRFYVEVRAEGVDERQIATILDSCWATPVNIANYPVRWTLISAE